MSKSKIAIYLALIFVAGAIAGGAVVLTSPETFTPPHRLRKILVTHHRTPEDFANHLWDQMKDRLKLDEGQAARVEPIFRAGFAEVRAIQDRSLQNVEAAIRKNHEEISALLTPEQKLELQKMNEEREEFFKNRRRGPKPGEAPRPPE